MRRIWLVAVAALVLVGAVTWRLPGSGQAEDTTGDRVSALETQVAGQASDITSLQKRVKALEKAKGSSSKSTSTATSSSSGAPVSLSGTGPTVTDKFGLKAGRYKVTVTVDVANFDGFILFVYPPAGREDTVLNEIIDHAGKWTGSAVFEAATDGDYYAEIQNTTSSWTITFEGL